MRLTRYLVMTLLGSILMVAAIWIGLEAFIEFVRQIDDLGKGQYHLREAVRYVLSALPMRSHEFSPMIGLMGSLIGLGRLASRGELVAMRASGLSIRGLSLAVLFAAGSFLMLSTAVGEGLGPTLLHRAEISKEVAISGGQMPASGGVWLRDHDTFVHIDTVDPRARLIGVTQYAFDRTHRLVTWSRAAQASFEKNQWILETNRSTDFFEDRAVPHPVSSQPWGIYFSPVLASLSTVDPAEMTVLQLSQWIDYRLAHHLDVDLDRLDFWQRLCQPLSALIMILLSVPCILGPLRSSTMGSRILVGFFIGLGFTFLTRLCGMASLLFGVPPAIGAIAPIVVVAGGLLFLMG